MWVTYLKDKMRYDNLIKAYEVQSRGLDWVKLMMRVFHPDKASLIKPHSHSSTRRLAEYFLDLLGTLLAWPVTISKNYPHMSQVTPLNPNSFGVHFSKIIWLFFPVHIQSLVLACVV